MAGRGGGGGLRTQTEGSMGGGFKGGGWSRFAIGASGLTHLVVFLCLRGRKVPLAHSRSEEPLLTGCGSGEGLWRGGQAGKTPAMMPQGGGGVRKASSLSAVVYWANLRHPVPTAHTGIHTPWKPADTACKCQQTQPTETIRFAYANANSNANVQIPLFHMHLYAYLSDRPGHGYSLKMPVAWRAGWSRRAGERRVPRNSCPVLPTP